MNIKNHRSLFLLLALLSLSALACSLFSSDSGGAPRNAAVVEVWANSSLTPWLETAVSTFNASETETADGKQVFVELNEVESGTAVTQLTADNTTTLWIPDEQVWVNVLADQGNGSFQGDCVNVATSPLVIGMWRPAAESLGWPGLPLGWLDIGSLAADPNAWAYYSGGQFGDSLRLSHTHPGLSGSGASSLLAVVQAAQSKSQAVSVDDIQQPIVQASVGSFESAVAWFSSSTATLGATMSERGTSYLGAAVMYESTVSQYGKGEIVPIYPLEGTFMATNPACINQNSDAENQEAATLFRTYLLTEEGQRSALVNGLRPVSSAVPLAAPLEAALGFDINQPTTIFNPPSVETIYAVQDLWQSARKNVNLVMLLDSSGSMDGGKITGMQAAAVQFVEQMGEQDFITIVEFYGQVDLLIDHALVGENRTDVINIINNIEPGGDTTLFDAVGFGGQIIGESTQQDTTNVMVVLTDGEDTASNQFSFNDQLISIATANDTTVFTIAYGRDANEDLLSTLATQGNGNFYLGDEASIAAIYEEMSAAFGGSVGVGR